MMKKKPFLSRLFARLFHVKPNEHEEELAFRCKMINLERETTMLKRKADQLKADAIRYENEGNHDRAKSAAAAAMTHERYYKAALKMLQDMTNTHSQALSHKVFTDIMEDFISMGETVTETVKPDNVIKIETEFTAMAEKLKEALSMIETLTQGFTPNTSAEVISEAGQAALDEIMASVKPQQEALPTATAVIPAAAPAPAVRLQADWVQERRKQVAEMT